MSQSIKQVLCVSCGNAGRSDEMTLVDNLGATKLEPWFCEECCARIKRDSEEMREELKKKISAINANPKPVFKFE